VPKPKSAVPAESETPAPAVCLDPGDTAAIFEAMGEAAYVWDATSDKLVWSPNATKVIGVETLDPIGTGRKFAARLDPANPFNRYDAIFGSSGRDEGTGVPYELRYSLKEDDKTEPRWIEDCGRWFAGANGKPARAAGVARVVTERH
jgi:PAS domain-containing protein